MQFGRTVTSKALETFFENTNTVRFMINEYGDWFDPSNRATAALACKPYIFCETMLEKLGSSSILKQRNNWLEIFIEADKIASKTKKEIIEKSNFANEPRTIIELLNALPERSQIMISNSMPIRDFDYFATKTDKIFTIFNNRGASGIDGITSTALGITANNNFPTILITGDLAFYHDLNGMLAAKKYTLPLTVILINNNGGGIFEVLPISDYGKVFKDYFIAQHNLNFKPLVEAYSGKYYLINSWNDFKNRIHKSIQEKNFTVLEIKTSAQKSLQLRRKFWTEVDKNLP